MFRFKNFSLIFFVIICFYEKRIISTQFSINLKSNSSIQPSLTLYPIILIPGDGGNRLYAKLDKKKEPPHFFCSKKTKDYFQIWFTLEQLAPLQFDCFVENIKLNYDNNTKKTSNTEGVDIRVENFGQTETVEYLDGFKIPQVAYFSTIVDALVTKRQYARGINVKGAPFDWRKAPNELDPFFNDLTKLIEDTYTSNNNTPVILIAHSMGNPVTLYWLNKFVNQEWKNKFIKSFVSLAGVWGGSTKTFWAFTSGYNLGIPFVNPLKAREIQRHSTGNVFLFPSDKFWQSSEVILSKPSRNYTINNLEQYFADINFELGYDIHKVTKDLINDLEPPRVESHFLYGTGLPTPERFFYVNDADFPDTQPKIINGDGDGTVNYRSQLGYTRWIGNQEQEIRFKEIKGAEHLALLSNQIVIDYILQLMYT